MSIQLKMIRSGALKLFRQQSEHRTIGFNITRACNYSCSYCVQDQQDFQVSHLPLEFITRVIDICASHGKVTALNFSGGEPTVLVFMIYSPTQGRVGNGICNVLLMVLEVRNILKKRDLLITDYDMVFPFILTTTILQISRKS